MLGLDDLLLGVQVVKVYPRLTHATDSGQSHVSTGTQPTEELVHVVPTNMTPVSPLKASEPSQQHGMVYFLVLEEQCQSANLKWI